MPVFTSASVRYQEVGYRVKVGSYDRQKPPISYRIVIPFNQLAWSDPASAMISIRSQFAFTPGD